MEPVEPWAPRRRPLFSARATAAVRLALAVLIVGAVATGYTVHEYYHSPYWSRVGLAPDQPVQFSHRHHAGELAIDCRFCHARVETAADAGLPATQTCLNCHAHLFPDSPMLAPVHASAATGVSLGWSRVTDLPDHVHFNHSIHVNKGIACASCHGDVTAMALTAKSRALSMRDCVECHRDPAAAQVTAAQVFSPRPASPTDAERALLPVLHPQPLTNCSTCHH